MLKILVNPLSVNVMQVILKCCIPENSSLDKKCGSDKNPRLIVEIAFPQKFQYFVIVVKVWYLS